MLYIFSQRFIYFVVLKKKIINTHAVEIVPFKAVIQTLWLKQNFTNPDVADIN